MTATDVSPTVTGIQPGAVFLLLLAVVFAAAAGYGWFGESRDYANYVGVYDALMRHDTFASYRFERGYIYLSWFCKFYLGMDFAQYYMFLACTSLLLKFRLLWKHTSAPVIAAVVYLMVLFPLHEYTQLRAAVALAFAYTAMDAYLDGKRFTAVLLLVVGVLFHATAMALAAAALFVLFVAKRSPVLAAALFSVVAVVGYLLISKFMNVLEAANPLVAKYVDQAFLNEPPNVFSGQNILLFALIVSSAIFLRPWQVRKDGFFFYLSFWTLITYVALLKIPAFAHRISEAFIFPCLLFPFRFDDLHQSRIPSVMAVLTGGWMVYEAVIQELLFVVSCQIVSLVTPSARSGTGSQGAYFTRYALARHHRLFRQFAKLGSSGGSGDRL